jgi:salicylate hydroxylase
MSDGAKTVALARPLLIAGGGIGGLAVALACADRGLACLLLERNSSDSQIGAGIQIGPNGVHALRVLGVADALEPNVGAPHVVHVRDARSGRSLATLPLGSSMVSRFGAPYWTAHRADLHAALRSRAQTSPLIRLTDGFDVDRVEATATGVRVFSTSGAAVTGHALIGADGVGSRVRGYVAETYSASAPARRAYRAVISAGAVPAGIDGAGTGLWLTGGAHVVHYPVRGGREIALIVILGDANGSVGWSRLEERDRVTAQVQHLAAPVRDVIAAATEWRSWALIDSKPLERWANGRIGLIGDAAHPVLPFLAQGGVLALEDAVTLAPLMARHIQDPALAFAAFETARRTRALRVVAASRRNGWIYHLRGPNALARNLAMASLSGPQLIAQYDWLYGWQPPVPSS